MAWSPLGPHNIPFYSGFGVETPFGIFLPPGSKVAAYVRSGGVSTQDSPEIQSRLVQTTAAALRYARSGRGDYVIFLPGHSENVTDATMLDNLVAGTKLVGVGQGSQMPTFRWTTTSSQWVLNDNDVTIRGLRLRMEGANGVVKALAWTGADCLLMGCDIELSSGASNKAAIGIEVASGSERCGIIGNRLRSPSAIVTDAILVGAVSDLDIIGNRMMGQVTAGNGFIRVSGAALSLYIARNTIANTTAGSTACIAFANVGSVGVVEYNNLATSSTGASTSGTEGIAFAGASPGIYCFQNFVANDKQTSGELLPTVDT